MRFASTFALAAFACLATLPANATPRKHPRAKPVHAQAVAEAHPLRHPARLHHEHPPDAATVDRVHAFIQAQHKQAQHKLSPQAVEAIPKPAPRAARRSTLKATLGPAPKPTLAPELAAEPAPDTLVAVEVSTPILPFAATPSILPTLYNKRGRLIVPPPLKGSHEILLHQNEVADRDGLTRIQDDADLDRMRVDHLLAPLPASASLIVDDRLPANRRYCRPWTAVFLAQLSREYYARFGTPLVVTSAVRTVEVQQHLLRINGNAAPAEGDTASPHLTGQAIDIAKHGLSLTEIAWLRGYLLPLVQQGKADVEEEFQQSCFHISVYRKYMPQPMLPLRHIVEGRNAPTSALAVTMP